MSGKDLIDSVTQSAKIARILGGRPPEGFNYEMFLDEKGEKISKSKGNGLSLEEWLRYGSEESLAFYIYREPRKAQEPAHRRDPPRGRRILAVPRQLSEPADRAEARQSGAPHPRRQGAGDRAARDLRAAAQPRRLPGVADKDTAWKFVQRYAPGTSAETDPELDELIGLAVNYARDFVVADAAAPPAQRHRKRRRCATSIRELAKLPPTPTAKIIQHARLRSRQAPPVRKPARLVPGALRNPARLQPRPAHGQLHRALRRRQQPQADRRGAWSAIAAEHPLLRCEPRLAADEDEFSSGVGLRQVGFDTFPVFPWQAADDFRNTPALTGSGEFKRPLDCRSPRHDRSLARRPLDPKRTLNASRARPLVADNRGRALRPR